MASISVQSYKIIEGKLGDSAKMQFIVMLSAPVSHEVKVDYATSDHNEAIIKDSNGDYHYIATDRLVFGSLRQQIENSIINFWDGRNDDKVKSVAKWIVFGLGIVLLCALFNTK